MGQVNLIQTNFTSGEISPLMYGRIDVNRYANGAKQIVNSIVSPHGGLLRRSGTRFVHEVKTSANYTRLLRFEFSNTQPYILEFGNLYVRVYANNGIVVDGGGSPIEVVTPYLTADLDGLRFAQSGDILYITHPSYQTQQLERFTQTSWQLTPYVNLDGPYLDENTTSVALQVSSITDNGVIQVTDATGGIIPGFFDGGGADVNKFIGYKEDNNWKLAKITGVSLIASNQAPSQMITAIKDDADPSVAFTWDGTNQKVNASNSGVFGVNDVNKYVYINAGASKGQWVKITAWVSSSQMTGSISGITMKSTTYPTQLATRKSRTTSGTVKSTAAVFAVTDVGRIIRLNFSGKQVWGTITAYTSGTQVTVSFQSAIPLDPLDNSGTSNTGTTTQWRLGAWSNTTGWPSTIIFHEQRLVFACTTTQPQTLWMSRSGDYYTHSPTEADSTVTDSCGINYTIASNRVNKILWLSSGATLLVGTQGEEWQVKAASTINEPISPTNISITPQTPHGSVQNVPAVRVGSALLFCQRSGRKIKELTYDFQQDSFVSRDLTTISEHILRQGGGAKYGAYQEEPNNVVWFVLSDGTIAGLTYVRDQEVVAWHRHQIASVGGTNGVVESVEVVPSADGTEDTLYMIVKRTIGGVTKRYIEYLEVDFRPLAPNQTVDKSDIFFVDCGLTYDGAPATDISGLTHLANQTVAVVADGVYVGDLVVSNTGHITLAAAASVVHAGLKSKCYVETLPPEGGAQAGTSQGKIKKIDKLDVKIASSMGFKYGPSLTDLQYDKLNDLTSDGTTSAPLYTGNRRVELNNDWDTLSSYFIVQDDPYPLNIVALMPRVTTME